MGRETQLSDIWGMIGKMAGIIRNTVLPVFLNNNKTAIGSMEKAELLAETLVKNSQNLSARAKLCRDATPVRIQVYI